jgi:hypothetical protein
METPLGKTGRGFLMAAYNRALLCFEHGVQETALELPLPDFGDFVSTLLSECCALRSPLAWRLRVLRATC